MSEHNTIVHTPIQGVRTGMGHWGDESTDKREKKCSWSLCYTFYLQCQVCSLPTISSVQIQTGALRPPHSVSSLKFSLTAIPVQTSVE